MSKAEKVRRVLMSAHKEMTKALEETGAPLGNQDHYGRALTHVAKQFGVQVRDLKVCGEFVVEDGVEKLSHTFMGFRDPSPNPDEKGRIISFKEALQRTWKPAR